MKSPNFSFELVSHSLVQRLSLSGGLDQALIGFCNPLNFYFKLKGERPLIKARQECISFWHSLWNISKGVLCVRADERSKFHISIRFYNKTSHRQMTKLIPVHVWTFLLQRAINSPPTLKTSCYNSITQYSVKCFWTKSKWRLVWHNNFTFSFTFRFFNNKGLHLKTALGGKVLRK